MSFGHGPLPPVVLPADLNGRAAPPLNWDQNKISKHVQHRAKESERVQKSPELCILSSRQIVRVARNIGRAKVTSRSTIFLSIGEISREFLKLLAAKATGLPSFFACLMVDGLRIYNN